MELTLYPVFDRVLGEQEKSGPLRVKTQAGPVAVSYLGMKMAK